MAICFLDAEALQQLTSSLSFLMTSLMNKFRSCHLHLSRYFKASFDLDMYLFSGSWPLPFFTILPIELHVTEAISSDYVSMVE